MILDISLLLGFENFCELVIFVMGLLKFFKKCIVLIFWSMKYVLLEISWDDLYIIRSLNFRFLFGIYGIKCLYNIKNLGFM